MPIYERYRKVKFGLTSAVVAKYLATVRGSKLHYGNEFYNAIL